MVLRGKLRASVEILLVAVQRRFLNQFLVFLVVLRTPVALVEAAVSVLDGLQEEEDDGKEYEGAEAESQRQNHESHVAVLREERSLAAIIWGQSEVVVAFQAFVRGRPETTQADLVAGDADPGQLRVVQGGVGHRSGGGGGVSREVLLGTVLVAEVVQVVLVGVAFRLEGRL